MIVPEIAEACQRARPFGSKFNRNRTRRELMRRACKVVTQQNGVAVGHASGAFGRPWFVRQSRDHGGHDVQGLLRLPHT